MHLARLAIVVCCGYSVACAHAIVTPTVAAPTPAAAPRDALLVLPGVGYSRAGERALRALLPAIAADGFDFYLPTFVARAGLEESRARLHRFTREQRLDRYERVHVFAFIAGGWAFNPLAETGALPNLATVVYDRSPYQERAPEVAREAIPFLAWVRHGPVVFDLARTRYAPLTDARVDVGLVIETRPTSFIRRFATTAERQGPYHFECSGFTQRYDDCLYVAMDHDELYTRFSEVWPEVRSFIRTGQFTSSANRTPPTLDRRADARR